MIPNAAGGSSSQTAVRWYSWPPIPAVIFLFILDIRTVFEPPFLMPTINVLIFIGASGLAACLGQRGFLAGGDPGAQDHARGNFEGVYRYVTRVEIPATPQKKKGKKESSPQ